MLLRQLFESKREQSVGIIFGRFNPPHMGHMKAWEMASENDRWFVGTNKSTQGPKDPLPFDIKVKAMEAVYPEIKGHIIAEQSWLTLASKIYKKHGNVVLNVYTDEAWVTKALVQYNGKEGAHGFYNFPNIQQQDTPRLSSATALRNAVAADNRDAFGQAAGVDPNTPIAGKPFFDVVKYYLMPHAEKAAAKAVKKKAKEPAELAEGPSLPSTLKSITTNGEPITQLYGKLKAMAKRWVDNNGSLKGFHRNAAGQSAQWFNNFYFNKLQNDLYALTTQVPKYAPPLIAFLKDASEGRERRINFTEISGSLPPILFNMGKRMKDESLTQFARSWKARKDEYDSYLSQLESEVGGDDDFDYPAAKPEKSKVPGQQNAQAEQIVNNVLSKLPKKIAGEIRNAIARSPNKIQALHQELTKRKIQGVAEAAQKPRCTKWTYSGQWPNQVATCVTWDSPAGGQAASPAKPTTPTGSKVPGRPAVEEDNDPCWDSHKMVGTKKKGGKQVPNCVPKEHVNNLNKNLAELSSDMLGRYKKAAGDDATKADKAGDFEKGHKRFKGIVKATNKQFDNDMKGKK
jgi:nicotinamide mononucleotide adenylyltransferase